MAGWYCNITLKDVQQDRVIKLLNQLHREAIVSPVERTYLTIYPMRWRYSSLAVAGYGGGDDVRKVEDSAWWQQEAPYDVEVLTEEVTARLKCPGLVVQNMDGSELYYALFDRGKVLDRYLAPGLEDGEFDFVISDYSPPTVVPAYGGNAALLCQYFGSPDAVAEVAAILQHPYSDSNKWIDAMTRNQLLVQALNLPAFTINDYRGASTIPGFRLAGK